MNDATITETHGDGLNRIQMSCNSPSDRELVCNEQHIWDMYRMSTKGERVHLSKDKKESYQCSQILRGIDYRSVQRIFQYKRTSDYINIFVPILENL